MPQCPQISNSVRAYLLEYFPCSVTVLSEESADGDGLSTACFALGLEKGLELIEQTPDTEAMFITEDGEMHFSKGFVYCG